MPHGAPPADRPPRLAGPLALCAGVALAIVFGSLHRLQHGDSLMPVLVSLYRWTPFYWGQDRYGMLVALAARPLKGPLENMLAQGFLTVFAGLSAFFLLARYALRDATYPVVGAVGAAAFVALAPEAYRFDYFIDSAPGVWLALGLGGLIALEPGPSGVPWPRRVVAIVLIVLAHWVNFATALYLGAFVGCRAVLTAALAGRFEVPSLRDLARRAAGSEPVRALGLLAVAAFVGKRLTRLSPDHQTALDALRPSAWPGSWGRFVGRTWAELSPPWWPAFVSVAAAAGLLTGWFVLGRRPGRSAWTSAAALIASAVGLGLFVGTRRWVTINAYAPRYLIPSTFFLQGGLLALAVAPFRGWVEMGLTRPGVPLRVWLACAVMLVGAAAIGYGVPAPGRPRAEIERRLGGRTAEILASGCTHVAGDYWEVWPSVFHANLVARERGRRGVIWGVTFRSAPIAREIRAVPFDRVRVAVPLGDGQAEGWLRAYQFPPMVESRRLSTIRVLRPEPSAEPRGAWARPRLGGPASSGMTWLDWLALVF
jgi:hypothetical protein